VSGPALKPAYLICGDQHGRVAQRRARLRALAESMSGAAGVELFEGEASTPERVAAALAAMTLAPGRRVLIVDGVERWRDRELEGLLAALARPAPDTTVAFFAREDARARAPERLREAVLAAGGDVAVENGLSAAQLPGWAQARAAELGLALGDDAARALVALVGERQERIMRELEKLALALAAPPQAPLGPDDLLGLTAAPAQARAWALADALVAGEVVGALRAYLSLRDQGERLGGLVHLVAQRLRTALEVALALEAGESAAQVRRRLRMPARAADRLMADARRAGSGALAASICALADLELASRGGRGTASLSEDSLVALALPRLAA